MVCLHIRYARLMNSIIESEHILTLTSLPLRRSLHIHPPPTRRRQIRLRIRLRTLVARADTRNDSSQRDQYAE